MSQLDAPLLSNIAARLDLPDRRRFAQASSGLRREAPTWPLPAGVSLSIREIDSTAQAVSLKQQLQAYVPPTVRLDIVLDSARHSEGYADLCLDISKRQEAGAAVRLSTMEFGDCTPEDPASAMLSRYFLGY